MCYLVVVGYLGYILINFILLRHQSTDVHPSNGVLNPSQAGLGRGGAEDEVRDVVHLHDLRPGADGRPGVRPGPGLCRELRLAGPGDVLGRVGARHVRGAPGLTTTTGQSVWRAFWRILLTAGCWCWFSLHMLMLGSALSILEDQEETFTDHLGDNRSV